MRLDCSGMEFEKLADLLEQGQFELLNLPVGDERKKPSDIRLVYMMNDTAESFLVFHEAVLTGNYLPDYEGELSASLDKEETDNTDAEGEEKGRYILAVHQGDTVCTLFFKNISLECELYDYGGIGHFWVKGYEYLRQLEYKIAILGDKWEYLGETCCSEEEKQLAFLRGFPPLSYLFYPAASLAYVREKEEPWKCSPLAAKLVEEAAKQEKDTWFAKMVSLYKRYPVRVLARYIAWMFHREAHKRVTDHLIRQMDQAAAIYPRRYFGEENEKKHKILFEKANKRKRDLEKQGIQAEIFREEPFAKGDDGLFKVYVMQFTVKKGNRISAVEEIR